MFGRNIDFFAVLFIALAMLGLAQARSWHLQEALDSIGVENAIQVDGCPTSRQVLSTLTSIFK